MNGLPYYKSYPRDFIEGTIGMDFELKAAYRLVLDLIYMQGGNLPDDARYISGLLGCTMKKWKSLRTALIAAGKLYVSGEFLGNNRADKELETLSKFQENQREKASKPRKNKDLQEATAEPARVKSEPEPDKYSVDKSTDAEASIDPEKVMFDSGRKLLVAAGITPAKAGSLLGKWRKDHGTEAVISALGRAQREGAIDPVAFIEGCFRFRAKATTPADGEVRMFGGVRKVYHSFSGWAVEHA